MTVADHSLFDRPARYRAMLFQQPLGPWRGSALLAQQDALDEGHGSREWNSGLVFLEGPAWIAREEGEEPVPDSLKLWVAALKLHASYGDRVLEYADAKLRAYRSAGDEAATDHWREVVIRLKATERASFQGGEYHFT